MKEKMLLCRVNTLSNAKQCSMLAFSKVKVDFRIILKDFYLINYCKGKYIDLQNYLIQRINCDKVKYMIIDNKNSRLGLGLA